MQYIILILVVFLASCQQHTGTVTTDVDSMGRPVRTTQTIDSKAYAELQMVQASEASNQAYYQAQQFKYARVAPEDVALLAAIEGLAGSNNPTNYNDALIAKQKASVDKHKTWAGFGKSVVTGTLAGVGIYKGAEVLKSAMGQGGVTVTGDNNEIRGTNTGENGTATYTNNEPVTNTTNEASSSESSESSSSSSTCESLGGVWVADEGRCSDGSGGTIDIDSGETTTEENTTEETTSEETTEESTSETTTDTTDSETTQDNSETTTETE